MQRRIRYASRLGVVVAAGCLAAGTAAAVASASPAAASPGWRIVARFGAPRFPAYQGIAADSASDAWITGDSQSSLAIRHWHNGKWQQLAVPASFAGGGSGSVFDGWVDASGATNMWTFPNLNNKQYGLHWNGKSWSKFTFSGVQTHAAAVFSANDAWMFGSKLVKNPIPGFGPSYVVRYNGRTWQRIATPGVVLGVRKISARDFWAYGPTSKTAAGTNWTYAAMHWNGTRWRALNVPKLAPVKNHGWIVTGMAALSDSNVWLSESVAATRDGTLGAPGVALLHWNGKRWQVAARNSAHYFGGLSYDGNGGFWLPTYTATGFGTSYLVHLRAGRWSQQATPAVSGFADSEGTLIRIPGTRSLWGLGTLTPQNPGMNQSVIVKFGR